MSISNFTHQIGTEQGEPLRVSRAAAIAMLHKGRRWVRLRLDQDVNPDEMEHAFKLMTFAIRAINRCDQRIDDWKKRKEGRLVDLRGVRHRFTTDRGNRTLINLIDLAISTIEAAIWVEDLPCLEFPEKVSRRQSPEHVASRVAARRKAQDAEKERLARMRQDRLEKSGL